MWILCFVYCSSLTIDSNLAQGTKSALSVQVTNGTTEAKEIEVDPFPLVCILAWYGIAVGLT